MPITTSQKVGLGAAGLLLAHLSGILAGAEHDVSPGLARGTLDLFHLVPDADWQAASAALKEAGKGSTDDQIAAKAACAYLSSNVSTSSDHDEIQSQILLAIAPAYRTLPGVQSATGKLATKLAGASQPGSYGHIYRSACFGIG